MFYLVWLFILKQLLKSNRPFETVLLTIVFVHSILLPVSQTIYCVSAGFSGSLKLWDVTSSFFQGGDSLADEKHMMTYGCDLQDLTEHYGSVHDALSLSQDCLLCLGLSCSVPHQWGDALLPFLTPWWFYCKGWIKWNCIVLWGGWIRLVYWSSYFWNVSLLSLTISLQFIIRHWVLQQQYFRPEYLPFNIKAHQFDLLTSHNICVKCHCWHWKQ